MQPFSSFNSLGTNDSNTNPNEHRLAASHFEGRTFDRLAQFDPRSRAFNVAAVLDHTKPRSYTWSCAPHLDQRAEGACVGFAFAHEAAARPKVHPVSEEFARKVYYEARTIDPWPGEDYDGTSTLAGAKVMQRLGFLKEYRWAFNLEDFLTAVSYHGPGLIGVNWYEGMMQPDTKGVIRATGFVVGGHCTLVKGVSVKSKMVKIHQSWGTEFGLGGDVLLSWDDLGKLLDEDGEAMIPVSRG